METIGFQNPCQGDGDELIRMNAGVEGAQWFINIESDLHYAFKSDDPDPQVQWFYNQVLIAIRNLKIFLGKEK